MAVFREGELTDTDDQGRQRERLDWGLMNFGPVALFRKDGVLADAINWLERHGYDVVQADCGDCPTEEEVLRAISRSLGFHPWPSPNLDGFNDDCRHVHVPDSGGAAVVLRRFDRVAARFTALCRTAR